MTELYGKNIKEELLIEHDVFLPFETTSILGEILDGKNDILGQEVEHWHYIVHACNMFPELLESLNKLMEPYPRLGDYRKAQDVIKRASSFLTGGK